MSLDDIGAAIFHMFLDWGLGSRYVVHVDRVSMRTHKFERSIIEGKVKYNARSIDRPDDDDIIYTAKEEHFGDRDRYIRPYSKNIRTFAAYNNNNNVDSYSYILYDRYENTVVGLCLKK